MDDNSSASVPSTPESVSSLSGMGEAVPDSALNGEVVLPDQPSALPALGELDDAATTDPTPSSPPDPFPSDPFPLPPPQEDNDSEPRTPTQIAHRARLIAGVAALAIVALAVFVITLLHMASSHKITALNDASNYRTTNVPLGGLSAGDASSLGSASQLTINGQLRINNSFILTPTNTPENPLLGQFYLNNQNDQLYYFNGQGFVSLASGSDTSNLTSVVSGLGSISRASPGAGLTIQGSQLINTGVTRLGGTTNQIGVSQATGAITLSLPQDIALNSTPTFSAIQVGSLTARPGDTGLIVGSNFQDLRLQGASTTISATANGFTTSLAFASPSATSTLIVPDIGGTICTTSGNCSGGGSPIDLQPTSPGTSQAGNGTITGTFIAGAFSGGGSALTGLNASNISTGALADARLSGNVALDNANNTFTGSNTFGSQISANGGIATNNAAITTGVGAINGQTISSSANFTGTLVVQGASLTVGVPGATTGSLNLANATSTRQVILQGLNPSGSGNATIQLPTIAGGSTDTICLSTLSNCTAIGVAGGDLTGTYPNPTIAKLQGNALTISSLSPGQILQYNGSAFVNQTVGGDVTINGSGVAAIGAGKVTNADLVNSSLTLNNGTNITGGGSVSLGGSLTVGVANNPTFSGLVTGSSGTTGLALTGTPIAGSGATSLFQLGSAIVGGNNVANGGTYIGLNEPASGAGSAADFLNFQVNGTPKLQVTNAGNITGGTFNGQTISSSANFTGTLVVQGANALTLGTASANTGAIVLQGSGGTGTLTLQGPTAPNAGNYTLTIPAITGNANICTDNSVCSGYAAASGSGNYIQNGTSLQSSASFNIQSANAANPVGVVRGAAGQTADIFQVLTSGGSTVALLGSSGTTNSFFGGLLQTGTGFQIATNSLTTGNFVKQYTAGTGGVNVNDVVVLTNDSGNARVKDTTTARDPAIYGVSQSTVTSGSTANVAFAGQYQVTATSAAVAIGDQLVTSTTSGQVMTDNSATTGILGIATSSKSAGSSGLVSVMIQPVGGQSAPRFQNISDSTAAFQIQNASGAQLFNVDTSNSIISIAGNNSGAVGAWTKQASALSQVRQQHSSVVANGYLYVLGGQNGNPGTTLSSVQYAPITSSGAPGSWTTASQSLPAAIDDAAAVTANGYVYMIGGYNGTSVQSTVYYAKLNADGSTGAWTTGSNSLPANRANPTAVVVNGYVYVMGGGTADNNPGSAQSTVYYAKLNADGSTGAWTTGSNPLPTAVTMFTAATANGYIYSLGGNGTGGNITTVYYAKVNNDGSTGSWTTSSNSLPVALRLGNSVVVNGYVYYINGFNGVSGSSFIYYAKLNADGSISTWTTNAINSSNKWFDTVVTWNGYLYDLAGGFANSDVYYASTERTEVGGSLDLVGATGQGSNSDQSGGALTAGNTNVLGTLSVSDQASFLQGVTVNGVLNAAGSVAFKPTTDSTSEFQIQNAASTSNVFDADTQNGRIGIGTNAPGAALDVQTATNIGLNVNQTGSNNLLQLQKSGVNVLQVTNIGAALFKNSTNSTTAFQILDSGNTNLLTADTTTDTLTVDNLSVTGTCSGCGSTGSVSLQSAYTTGSTITTTNANNITFNLANTATPANFVVQNAGTNVFAVAGNGGAVTAQNSTNSGTAFQIQNAAGSNSTDSLLSLSTVANANNLVTNGSFEQNTTGWAAKGNMAISQVGSVNAPFGNEAMQITNSGTPVALNGAKFPVTMVNGTVYALSFYARSTGSTFSTLSFGRADNGATDTACSSTSTTSLTSWLRFTCTFTAGAQSGTPYIFIGQNDTTARTWYVDGVSFEAVANGSFYKEGALNLNGLALGNTLIQPAVNSNQAFVVASASGLNGLTVDTNGAALTSSFATTINNTTVVSNTSTSALAVRNSTTVANLIRADTSTINNSDLNGSFETSAGTATNYSNNHAGATISVDTTAGNAYEGNNTGKEVTTGSAVANSGVKYNLTTATMASATTYTLSFYAKLVAGQSAFTTLTAGRAEDGATETACTLNSTTLGTFWQRYTCTFTTGTSSGTPYFYIGQSDAGVAHSYYLDGIQFTNSGFTNNNYNEGKIQLNGVVTSPTIFQPNSDGTGVFQIQDANGSNELSIDTTTSNMLLNSGFDIGSGGWAAKGTDSSFGTDSTASNVYQGSQSLKAVVTAATSGMSTSGGQAAFTTAIAASTQYQLTFYAKCDSTYNTLTYGRQDVVGTDVNSVTNGTCTTNWQQYTAHWTTGGTITNPDIYVNLGSTTAGTVWIDAVSLVQTTISAATNYNIGNISIGGVFNNPTIFQNGSNSTTAFQVQNAAGSSVFNIDTQNQRVGIGTNAPNSVLTVGGTANTLANLQSSPNTGAINIVSNFGSGTSYAPGITWSTPDNNASFNKAGIFATFTSSGSSLLFGTSNNYGAGVTNTALTLNSNGGALFQNGSNSTTAFQVQNAAGQSLFNADTSNMNITLNGYNGGQLTNFASNTALPNSRRNLGAVALNGYIYAIGGDNGSTAQSTVYYSQVNSTGALAGWNTTTTLPSVSPGPGLQDMSVVASGKYVYVIGGTTDGTDLNATQDVFYAKQNADGTLGAWTLTSLLPYPNILAGAVVYNGYIYFTGGENNGSTNSATYYAKINADGTLGSWTNLSASLPAPSTALTMGEANGYLYAFGGFFAGSSTNSVLYAKINADGTIGAWVGQSAAVMPITVDWHTSVMSDGFVYVIGGTHSGGAVQSAIQMAFFNSDGSTGPGGNGNWSIMSPAPLSVARQQAATVAVNGYIYEIGGNDGTTTFASVLSASTSRTQIGGSLDLVGPTGAASNLSGASGGGTLTAGDTSIIGNLSVTGQGTFGSSIQSAGNLTIGGSALFQDATNSSTAFQIQNSAGTSNLFDADTTNNRIGINTNAPGNLLSIGALTTAANTYQVAVSTGGTTTSGIVIQTMAGQSGGNILQAQDSTGAALATIDYQGNLTVKAATINGTLTVNGHVVTGNSSGSTTAAVSANAGTGGSPACGVSGNDSGGQITLTTGTSAWASGTQCTITFANAFGSAPHPVISNATNVNTAAVGVYVNSTTAIFTINFMNADTAQHTYAWNYFNAQ